MCQAIENFFSRIWAWAKAAFGHSKIVFVNIFGAVLAVYVELQDYLISFNWDDFFKHEVAVTIGLVTQVMSVILRVWGTNGAPATFTPVPAPPPVEVVPDEEASEISPKANG